VATPYQQVIEIVSKGATSTLKVLNNIEKSLTNIFKKQEAVNRAALKFNKVRAATRRVKGSGLNLSTSEDRTVSSKASAQTKRYTEALNRANKQLNAYVRSLATADGAQNKFTGSSRKITTQVSALQERLNSLSRSNKEYTSTLQATLRGEQALYKVQRNRAVDELAQFPEVRLKKDGTPDKRFKRTGVEDLVGTTIAELDQGKIANSINGLNNYIDRLEALRAKVQLGSKSFNDLQQQIALVNLKLKEADPLSFSSKIDPKQKAFTLGAATDLSDTDSVFRQKLAFAEKLSRVDDKRLQIQSRISDSSLSEVTKQQLKTQLAQTEVNLQKEELDLARLNNKEVEKELSNLDKKQQKQNFRAGRKGRIAQSALIGGGFPFLFGGGPLQALAGGLGGGIGEAVSPGGGFAGSIAATAAISQIAQGVEALGNLGKAMNKATMDTTALIAAMGMAGTVDSERIQLIEQLEGKQAAFNAAMEEMKGVVGDEGAAALQRFGDSTKKLQDAWAKFMTRLMAGVAIILEKLGIIDGMDNQTKTFNRGDIRDKIKESGDDTEIVRLRAEIERIQGISGSGGRAGAKNRSDLIKSLQQEIEQRALILLQQDQSIKIGINRQKTLELVTKDMTDQETLLKESLSLGNKEAQIREKIRAINKDLVDMKKTELTPEEAKQIRLDFIRIDNLTKMKELYDQIKDTIATGLTSAIEGLIAGTKTLGESLASIAKSIASMFLNSAISSLVGNISFGKPSVGTQVGNMIGKAEGGYMANGIKPFASGGLATRPTLGLVGEAGEDEYIIPASKMASSMQRYSAGARGEAVIPGTGSSYAGGGAGGSTTVNYSGPILNFNSEEFVPKSAVGQIIATAAKKGASMGETRTMRTFQTSRSARSRVGI